MATSSDSPTRTPARRWCEYLYQRGRRRIGFVGGRTSFDTRGTQRRAGFRRAARALGLPSDRIILAGKTPVSMAQGSAALEAMLTRWPDVDAIVCVSDLSAFGVLAECQRRGIDVPGRIAIAGFGDFEVARCCHPRLTTSPSIAPTSGARPRRRRSARSRRAIATSSTNRKRRGSNSASSPARPLDGFRMRSEPSSTATGRRQARTRRAPSRAGPSR